MIKLIGGAAMFAAVSCVSNSVEKPVTVWSLDEEMSSYEHTFRESPLIWGEVKGSLSYARHTTEYRKFLDRLPSSGAYDSTLIYYEIAVNHGHYFFYWSGVQNGNCAAYFSTSESPYVEVSECNFPSMQYDWETSLDENQMFADNLIVGLRFSSADAPVEHLLVLNPEVELGTPTSRSIPEKIEAVFERPTSQQ